MAFAEDYNTVPERLAEFREKYPDGSLQPLDLANPFFVAEISGATFIVYAAAAYRTPDDPRPGVGLAYEPFPGKTNFTRDSELQNAETSAWGRAIVAALAADTKKGIATHEEVSNRQAAQEARQEKKADKDTHGVLRRAVKALDDSQRDQYVAWAKEHGIPAFSKRDVLTVTQAEWVENYLDSLDSGVGIPSDGEGETSIPTGAESSPAPTPDEPQDALL